MSSIHDAGALAQPQDSAQTHVGTLVGPAELAKRHGLKRHQANGKTEWHGPNPSGQGATSDGFILKADGSAFERNGKSYTSCQVAELCGLAPEQYEPVARYRNEHSQNRHSKSKPSSATKPRAASTPKVRLEHAPFHWNKAKIYSYKSAEGVLLFEVGRCDAPSCEKSIKQRRPRNTNATNEEDAGGWLFDVPASIERPLWRLHDVIEAEMVFVCEGEKAAERLNEALDTAGLYGSHLATTAPGGAGKWKPEHSQVLEGKAVVVLPDNDEPGHNHATQVCTGTKPLAASLKRVELPGLPPKGDVADFLEAGGTADELLDLAERASDWAPSTVQAEAPHRRFVLRSLAEIKARPRLGWLIDGVVPLGGFVGIVGQYGSYKSFVAIDWALCVATGRAWHGREVKPGHVVYITPEGTDGISDRVEAWCIAHGEEQPENFHLIEEAPQLMQQRDVDELLEVLSEIPNRIALVVVDTVARHMVGGDENGQKDMGTFVAGADAIRRATGATLAAVHHTNKEGGMRGSTVLPGALDCYLTTYRTADKCITLGCGKAPKDGPGFTALGLRGRVMELGEVDAKGRPITSLVFLSDPQGARAPELTPNAKTALAALPAEGAIRAKWLKLSGMPETSFDRARKELENGRYIKRDDANVYKSSNIPPRNPHGASNGGTTTPTS